MSMLHIPHLTGPSDCLICTSMREWAIAACAGSLLFLLIWAIFMDTNNARSIENELRNEDGVKADVFSPGDTLWSYRMVCLDKVVPGTVVVEVGNLKTGAIYPMGTRPTGAHVGCRPRTVSAQLPPDLPPGTYEYRSTVTYYVNPLRTMVVSLPPMRFTVQSPKKEQQ